MPRESFSAAHEHSHPYSRPSPPEAPPDPDPPTSSSHPELEPSLPPNDYDSENEDWQDLLEESTHSGRKFPFLIFETVSDRMIQVIFRLLVV